jgi:hypothetical protein
MLTILTQAFRRTTQNWKIVLLIFLVNFCLGLCLALPVFNILQAESHGSLAFNNLVADFDFTVFNDFLNKSSQSLKPIFPISLVLSIAYVVLNVFFSGGILSQFTIRDTFRITDFLKNSAHYFGKFFLLFLLQVLALIIFSIISILILLVFGKLASGNTEPKFVLTMIPAFIFVGIYLSYILNVGDYAKVLLHRDSLINPWQAFWKASHYVIQNFKTMYIYWAVLLAAAILMLFYLWLESVIGMVSGLTIGLMFLIQQVFIFCRVFVRTWNLSNAYDYVSLRPIPITIHPIIVEPIFEEESESTSIQEEDNTENKLSE